MKEIDVQQELIEMLDKMVKYFDEISSDSYYYRETAAILDEAEKLVEKAKNCAKEPAVPPIVYLVENRTCLLAYASREDADKAVASMAASVGGGFLVSPVQVFGAAAPSQERCCTCGYLTSEREHLGCLRKAVKDLDAATGGPYPSQPVTLTDSSVDAAAKILAERFDYSWEHMPEQGRENMRKNVRNVVAALREKEKAQ